MKKIFCDLCGANITNTDHYCVTITVKENKGVDVVGRTYTTDKDLCPKCFKEVQQQWFNKE